MPDNVIKLIHKRDGRLQEFRPELIANAVHKALLAVHDDDRGKAEEVSRMGFKVEGLDGLKAAREELAATLEPRVIRQYQTAAGRYAGRAVVPVKDRVCLGCWAMQPTGFEALADRIATCQSCGRILYPV